MAIQFPYTFSKINPANMATYTLGSTGISLPTLPLQYLDANFNTVGSMFTVINSNNGETTPSGVPAGALCYDTYKGILYIFDGTKWDAIQYGSSGGSSSSSGITTPGGSLGSGTNVTLDPTNSATPNGSMFVVDVVGNIVSPVSGTSTWAIYGFLGAGGSAYIQLPSEMNLYASNQGAPLAIPTANGLYTDLNLGEVGRVTYIFFNGNTCIFATNKPIYMNVLKASLSSNAGIAVGSFTGLESITINFPPYSPSGSWDLIVTLEITGTAGCNGHTSGGLCTAAIQQGLSDGKNTFAGSTWGTVQYDSGTLFGASDTIMTNVGYPPGSSFTFTHLAQAYNWMLNPTALAGSTNMTIRIVEGGISSPISILTPASFVGVFAIGNSTTTTNIYTYSSNAVAAGTSLKASATGGAAAGNSTLGIFAIGYSTTTTNIYTYSSNAVAAGTSLTATVDLGAAAGNSTMGVFATGHNTATTNIYTYSSNAVAAGSSLKASAFSGAAAGNSTMGVFAIGYSTTTNIYTYSSNTVAAGSSLKASSTGGAAAGNSTLGIFAIGNITATTNIYTYSSNAVAAGTSLTATAFSGAAAGNSTMGVFAVGNTSTTTNIYTYSSNTVAAGSSLTAVYKGAAASNWLPT